MSSNIGAKEVVDLLKEEFKVLVEFLGELNHDEFNLATDCPGWTVKDNVSHLLGIEEMLLGVEPTKHVAKNSSWVKNPMGELNENRVDSLRKTPAKEVVSLFESAIKTRLANLEAMNPVDFQAETMTPTGPGTTLDLLEIRILDLYVHEQDMRRATKKPGHQGGPVVESVINRLLLPMPMVFSKRAKASDGETLLIVLKPPVEKKSIIVVQDHHGKFEDSASSFTVEMVSEPDAFIELTCGRTPVKDLLASRRIEIKGSVELGLSFLENSIIMI